MSPSVMSVGHGGGTFRAITTDNARTAPPPAETSSSRSAHMADILPRPTPAAGVPTRLIPHPPVQLVQPVPRLPRLPRLARRLVRRVVGTPAASLHRSVSGVR